MPLIAVIDDDSLICAAITEALRGLPAEIHCASGGDAGAQLLRAHRFDLAVIDVMLPGIPGLSLACVAADLSTPAVMMSGHPDGIEQCRELGFHCLAKPFRIDALTHEVRRVLADGGAALSRVREAAAKLPAAGKSAGDAPPRV